MGDVALERVQFAGPDGATLEGLQARPGSDREGPLPAVVVATAPSPRAGAPSRDEAVERFVQLGFVALAPELESGAEALTDRQAVARLDAAAAHLERDPDVDAESIAVFGRGTAGAHAFLLGCQSRRIAAVVDWGSPVVYPELSGERPVQPLEMALNLSAPMLGVYADGDATVPPEHVDALEETLARFALSLELLRVPAWGEAATATAWSRTAAFLAESLGLSGDESGD